MNEDPEFALVARFWSGRFRVGIGDDARIVQIDNGRVEHIEDEPTVFDEWDFSIGGPSDGWEKMLQPEPRPFYQDIWSAVFWHDFTIEGDLEQFFAYHAAVRRTIQLMRQLVSV